jgi:ferredoxin
MKVRVDDDRCQGHTLCNLAAPEVFFLRDDDGHAYVSSEEVPPALEDKTRRAALTCPEQAIVITD